MKYDCELIQDIASLYRDKALSGKSEEIVEEHLSECENCKNYYSHLYDKEEPLLLVNEKNQEEDTRNAARLAKRLRFYRTLQIGMFLLTGLTLLTMLVPWFGYQGVTEISGLCVLRHPLAWAGLLLFMLAIWYPFKKSSYRFAWGDLGWIMLSSMQLLEFLTIPAGYTTGIYLGPFHFDIPNFSSISLASSLSFTLPGFYLGMGAFIITAVLFFFFVWETRPETMAV